MNTYIGVDVKIETDVVIEPNTFIYGNSVIKEGAHICSGSFINDSVIGKKSMIINSRIVDSKIGTETTVGPYAHIRNHSDIRNHVRVGNFVEMKNTVVKDHTATAHLTYLGDAEVGEHVNVGCGVVTINYDGNKKHKTIIGDHTFVGSQSGLVAPLTIGENVVIAAGSVITEDVETGDFAIARSRQTIKPGKGKQYLNEKGKI